MIKNPFGSLPAFIFSYPFSVLLVVRLYAVDAILSTISIIFVICGLSAASSTEVDPKNNDLFYIIICHLYLFIAQFFSLVFTVICAKNTVSRLFIDVFSVFS
ncbi:hypothetical protein M3Y98_00128700 [Aphelenchoides besseyi]|nr:hypothetical protein M3Y98_00128700 [Aphelenchoides besseyi]